MDIVQDRDRERSSPAVSLTRTRCVVVDLFVDNKKNSKMLRFVFSSSLVDSSRLSGGDGHDADGANGEQVEGRRSHNRPGSKLSALEVVANDFDAGE